jgi:hypothetical protein
VKRRREEEPLGALAIYESQKPKTKTKKLFRPLYPDSPSPGRGPSSGGHWSTQSTGKQGRGLAQQVRGWRLEPPAVLRRAAWTKLGVLLKGVFNNLNLVRGL